MARRGKLSRDQKRKQKLAQRAKREPIQPYQGNKYKSEQFVEALMRAETGIYEAYVATDRQLTDRDVERSLEHLILELRGQTSALPARSESEQPDDFIAWRIKSLWQELFTERRRHSNSDLAGILRTILGSIRVWSRPGPDSRGYLHYIEGFLGQMGVKAEVLRVGEEEDNEPGDASDEEVLTGLGEAWVASRDRMAKKEFLAEAEDLLKEGQAGLVLEVCQRLIGMTNDVATIQELKGILNAAWKQEPPRPQENPFRTWLGRVAHQWLRPHSRS